MRMSFRNWWRVWQSNRWHKGGCGAPQSVPYYVCCWGIRKCVSSNGKWTMLSPTLRIGALVTLKCVGMVLLRLQKCSCMVTWSLRLVRAGFNCLTAIIRPRRPNPAWMLFLPFMEFPVSVSFSGTLSGSWVCRMAVQFRSSVVCASTDQFLI